MGRLRIRSKYTFSKKVGTVTFYDLDSKRVFFTSNKNIDVPANLQVTETERTIDELHHGPPYLDGGPFASYKSTYAHYQIQNSMHYARTVGGTNFRYDGGFIPLHFGSTGLLNYTDLLNAGRSGPYGPGFGDPSSHGAAAIKKFRPKTSGFDGATFLGELRDLPGMIKSAAKKFDSIYQGMGGKKTDLFMPKSIAKDYLEYNFGWVPFLSDMRKLYNTYKNQDKVMRRLRRQNNTWIKKGGIILETGTVTDRSDLFALDAPAVWPPPPTQLCDFPYPGRPNKWGNTLFETQSSTEIWFEGSFKYYIPWMNKSGEPNWNYIRGFMQVYGLRISPSVIYNLTPWSWLADYFGNAGDIVDNVTAITMDRLVTRYAYLMQRERRKRLNASCIHLCGGTTNCLWADSLDTKRRVTASPFGFNLKSENLSQYQWSILGALGLSRGRK